MTVSLESAALIGFDSALALWRQLSVQEPFRTDYLLENAYSDDELASLDEESAAAHSSLVPLAAPRGLARAAEEILGDLELPSPLHCVASRPVDRRSADKTCCHCWRHPIPDGLVSRVSHDLYVTGPELTFMQMATRLPTLELTQVAFELCGPYALAPTPGHPAMARARPLTTTGRLRQTCALFCHARGAKTALGALRHVADGSRSPMESQVMTVLCLPRRNGGCGCQPPLLNHRLDLDERGQAIAQRGYLVLDMYFPDARIDFEYKGRDYHGTMEQQVRDDERSNALLHMGIRTINAWSRHAYDGETIAALAELASEGGRRDGRRRRPDSEATKRHRDKLLKSLKDLSVAAFGKRSWRT